MDERAAKNTFHYIYGQMAGVCFPSPVMPPIKNEFLFEPCVTLYRKIHEIHMEIALSLGDEEENPKVTELLYLTDKIQMFLCEKSFLYGIEWQKKYGETNTSP